MSLAIQYAVTTVQIANKMMGYHWLRRTLMSWFTPEIAQSRSQFKKASALLEPYLAERLERCLASDLKKPDDLMQWLIDSIPEGRTDLDLHTAVQLEAVQAATFNLSFQVRYGPEDHNLLTRDSS